MSVFVEQLKCVAFFLEIWEHIRVWEHIKGHIWAHLQVWEHIYEHTYERSYNFWSTYKLLYVQFFIPGSYLWLKEGCQCLQEVQWSRALSDTGYMKLWGKEDVWKKNFMFFSKSQWYVGHTIRTLSDDIMQCSLIKLHDRRWSV